MMTFYHLDLYETAPRVVLLGYPLNLSETELAILESVCREHPNAASVELLVNEHGLTKNSLAVHICSLNKKAALISGRRLIVFDGGYRLNEFM